MKAFFVLGLMAFLCSTPEVPTTDICDQYTTVKTNTATGKTMRLSKDKLKIADSGRKMLFDMFFVKEGDEVTYLLTSSKPLVVNKRTKVKVKFKDGSSMKIRTTNQKNVENALAFKFEMGEKSQKDLNKIIDREIEEIEFKTGKMKFHLDFKGLHKTYVRNTLDCLLSRI